MLNESESIIKPVNSKFDSSTQVHTVDCSNSILPIFLKPGLHVPLHSCPPSPLSTQPRRTWEWTRHLNGTIVGVLPRLYQFTYNCMIFVLSVLYPSSDLDLNIVHRCILFVLAWYFRNIFKNIKNQKIGQLWT